MWIGGGKGDGGMWIMECRVWTETTNDGEQICKVESY